MIYTVTFSPAVDYVVYLDAFRPGETNRTIREDYFFGGKGINVSTVLTELGIDNTAMGFISGFTGEALENGLHKKGIRTDFVKLDEGITRINIKLKTDIETEINAQGPKIEKRYLEELIEKLAVMKEGDMLVLSGNVPNTLPQDVYERILCRIQNNHIAIVVDATGDLLKRCLSSKPFLVKPNKAELEELLGVTIGNRQQLESAAEQLQSMGAENVLVSLGGDGAFLKSRDGGSHYMAAVKTDAINTVGAGDSMVAGFIAGYISTGDYVEAMAMGIAAGSATASSEGLAEGEKIKGFRRMIDIGG